MSDRSREDWGPKHRQHVYWFEKSIAGVAFLFSLVAVLRVDGFAQYILTGVLFVSVWKLFPSIRPLSSWVVQHLPFLKSDPGKSVETGTQEIEFPRQDG